MPKKKVCLPTSEFIDEHKKLLSILRSGTPKQRKAEAKEQSKELAKVGGGIEEDIEEAKQTLKRKEDEIAGLTDMLQTIRERGDELLRQFSVIEQEHRSNVARMVALNELAAHPDTQPDREASIDEEIQALRQRAGVLSARVTELQTAERTLVDDERTLRNQLRTRQQERFRLIERLRELDVDVPTTEAGDYQNPEDPDEDPPMLTSDDQLIGRGREEQKLVMQRQVVRRGKKQASRAVETLFKREDDVLSRNDITLDERASRLRGIRKEQGLVLDALKRQEEAERQATVDLTSWFEEGDFSGHIIPGLPKSPRLSRKFPERPERGPSSLRMMSHATPVSVSPLLAPPFAVTRDPLIGRGLSFSRQRRVAPAPPPPPPPPPTRSELLSERALLLSMLGNIDHEIREVQRYLMREIDELQGQRDIGGLVDRRSEIINQVNQLEQTMAQLERDVVRYEAQLGRVDAALESEQVVEIPMIPNEEAYYDEIGVPTEESTMPSDPSQPTITGSGKAKTVLTGQDIIDDLEREAERIEGDREEGEEIIKQLRAEHAALAERYVDNNRRMADPYLMPTIHRLIEDDTYRLEERMDEIEEHLQRIELDMRILRDDLEDIQQEIDAEIARRTREEHREELENLPEEDAERRLFNYIHSMNALTDDEEEKERESDEEFMEGGGFMDTMRFDRAIAHASASDRGLYEMLRTKKPTSVGMWETYSVEWKQLMKRLKEPTGITGVIKFKSPSYPFKKPSPPPPAPAKKKVDKSGPKWGERPYRKDIPIKETDMSISFKR